MDVIKKKFYQLLNRSFSNDLGLFLFERFLNGESESVDLIYSYKLFIPPQALISLYGEIKQLAKASDKIPDQEIEVGKFDVFLKKWNSNNKDMINELKMIYKDERFISLENFTEFYNSANKLCFYCKITEPEILQMIKDKRIYTKRLFVRGRKLEIDKMNSKDNYILNNMVFCCYWCNNAKTDEFTHEEFRSIGKEITKIWNRRRENFS